MMSMDNEEKLLKAIDEQDRPIGKWVICGTEFVLIYIESENELLLMSKDIGDDEFLVAADYQDIEF